MEEDKRDDGGKNGKGASSAADVPRVISKGTKEQHEERKRRRYGTEDSRVLNLAEGHKIFHFIKLLSLLNSFCYPMLAWLAIRLQLLYYRYSYHQEEDKYFNTFGAYLSRWDYDGDKLLLLGAFGGTLFVSVLL
mmetsp:Transcript_9980/g.13571  ORF Transcript_9980/g.13571 Transcript_9980/m.13571 type:complete len:134 (+) Transcript_9980:2027-2428(+)